MTFDYIVVGGGSAGCVLANKLSESGRDSVLLLEAGPGDQRPYVRMPLGYGKVYYDKNVNWKYQTESVPGLNDRPSYWPRGKVLGGSSSINAMVYVRGHPHDYQEWSDVASGWAWSDVGPVFKRMEDWSGEASEARGVGGPLSVRDMSDDAHPLCDIYLQAAEQCQIPFNSDYNAQSMEGAALYQITTREGLRASSSTCYLRPVMGRHNLTVITKAHTTRILFDENASANRLAVGVQYLHRNKLHTVKARREVVVSAGAINSPQLLQHSGIGPAALLQQFDIPVVQACNEVGRNLQDHLGADLVCRTNVDSLNQQLRPLLGKMRVGLEFLLKRTGPLTLSLNQGGGFVSTNQSTLQPDLQLYFSPVSYTRAPVGTRPLISPDPFPGFLIGFNPCKPTSKGYLEIQSANPLHAPKLVPNYLDTQNDRNLMLEGIHLMRKMTSAPAFKQVIEEEILPGSDVNTDEQLAEFIKDNAWTVFHQCGTCRMGDDAASSVVDARLRVHGVRGLRVADASVFPTIPTGNTNAPSIMVGERAADFILQDNQQ